MLRIVGNKFEIKNVKTETIILQRKYGINDLLKINKDFDIFENNNVEEKEKIVKEHKTNLKVRKEGLETKNIVSENGKPKRTIQSKQLWKNL